MYKNLKMFSCRPNFERCFWLCSLLTRISRSTYRPIEFHKIGKTIYILYRSANMKIIIFTSVIHCVCVTKTMLKCSVKINVLITFINHKHQYSTIYTKILPKLYVSLLLGNVSNYKAQLYIYVRQP